MTDIPPCQPFSHDTSAISRADTLTPAERYQELFVAVQMQRVFPDSKTFVDCAPRRHPEAILEDYRARCGEPGFDLEAFVHEHFSLYEMPVKAFVANPDDSLAEHIDRLWPILTRHPQDHPEHSSLLPLPHDYVVPGGRFTELYYWDSYFTMLGLDESGHCDLLRAMADNFAYLIDTYGHVPNGNRTYYLGRSQPPVFALMTELFEETGVHRASDYLPQLHKEYAFWMEGADVLRPGEAHRRCVCLADGMVLNRYWDERATPREESYREDVETARSSCRPRHEVYRDLRAGAESGWDFSSRWLDDAHRLATIRTTSILPVDLNALLYKLERQIAELSAVKNQQAAAVAATVQERLLAPGGLATTEIGGSGEQWDRPNGWAPLQWIGIRGLQHYGHDALALDIEERWLTIVSHLFERENKLVEKYVLRPCTEHAGGGEYPLQDGFGWTNGVTRKLMQEDPNHEANRCREGHCRSVPS